MTLMDNEYYRGSWQCVVNNISNTHDQLNRRQQLFAFAFYFFGNQLTDILFTICVKTFDCIGFVHDEPVSKSTDFSIENPISFMTCWPLGMWKEIFCTLRVGHILFINRYELNVNTRWEKRKQTNVYSIDHMNVPFDVQE